jgi:hypothetical protein
VPEVILVMPIVRPVFTGKFCSEPFWNVASLSLLAMTVACFRTLAQPRRDARSRRGSGWLTRLAVAERVVPIRKSYEICAWSASPPYDPGQERPTP